MVRAIQEELCWYVGLNYTTIYPTFYAEDFLACLSMMGPTLKVWSMLYNCKANYTEKFDMSQISVTWVKNLMYRFLGFAGLQIWFASYKYKTTWSFISKLGNKISCFVYREFILHRSNYLPHVLQQCALWKAVQAGGVFLQGSKFLHSTFVTSAPLSMLRLSASQHVLVLNLTSETRHWSSCVDWCKVTWLDWCGYRQICLADLSSTVAALHCQLKVSNHSKNMESGKVCIAWCYLLMFFLFCIHCFMSVRLMKCMYSRHERQCHTW